MNREGGPGVPEPRDQAMAMPVQLPLLFGPYLLTHDLAEPASDRARFLARMTAAGADSLCEVTLLRAGAEAVFSHPVVDPRVSPIIAAGDVDGQRYVSQSFVTGASLSRLLFACAEAQQPIPEATALYLLRELLDALTRLHRRDQAPPLPGATHPTSGPMATTITHGGLSPALLYLTWSGDLRVRGLGLSPFSEGPAFVYRAPEQLNGGDPDPRWDVYASGVIFYETLFAESWHAGLSGADVRRAKGKGGFTPRRWGQMGSDVRRVLLGAIHPDPAQRYADANVFRDALDPLIQARGAAGNRAGLGQVLNALLAEHRALEAMVLAESRAAGSEAKEQADEFEAGETSQTPIESGSTDPRTDEGVPRPDPTFLEPAPVGFETGSGTDVETPAFVSGHDEPISGFGHHPTRPDQNALAARGSSSGAPTDEQRTVPEALLGSVPAFVSALDAPVVRDAAADKAAVHEPLETANTDPTLGTQSADPPLMSSAISLADPGSGPVAASSFGVPPTEDYLASTEDNSILPRSAVEQEARAFEEPNQTEVVRREPSRRHAPAPATPTARWTWPLLAASLFGIVVLVVVISRLLDAPSAANSLPTTPDDTVLKSQRTVGARIEPNTAAAVINTAVINTAVINTANLADTNLADSNLAGDGEPRGMEIGNADAQRVDAGGHLRDAVRENPSPSGMGDSMRVGDQFAAAHPASSARGQEIRDAGAEASPVANPIAANASDEQPTDERRASVPAETRSDVKRTRSRRKRKSRRRPPATVLTDLEQQLGYLKKWCARESCTAGLIKEGQRWVLMDANALRRFQARSDRCVKKCRR